MLAGQVNAHSHAVAVWLVGQSLACVGLQVLPWTGAGLKLDTGQRLAKPAAPLNTHGMAGVLWHWVCWSGRRVHCPFWVLHADLETQFAGCAHWQVHRLVVHRQAHWL